MKVTALNAGQCSLIVSETDPIGKDAELSIPIIVEPKADPLSLYFKDDASAFFNRKLENDMLAIHFEVTNRESGKEIKAFELCAYATDVWGNRIYGDGNVYTETTVATVLPGSTVNSEDFMLSERSKIAKVYCGIHKVLYTDGTTATDEDMEYVGWIIK